MKRKNELARSSIALIACIVIPLLFMLFSVVTGNHEYNTDTVVLKDINDGWIDGEGQAVNLYSLALGSKSVILDISKLNVDGMALCFKSYDTNFTVYASNWRGKFTIIIL